MQTYRLTSSSLMSRKIHKFFSNRLAIVGLVILVVLIIVSFFSPLLAPHDPTYINTGNRLQLPSAEHWLGTDNVGRDVFSRLLYGGRISMLVGFVSAIGATLIGVVLGCISGYFGRKIDNVLLYLTEIVESVPTLILILILIGFTGNGLINLIIIFSFSGYTGAYRIVRSRIISLKEEAFVDCCRANGINGMSIMFKHLLPNMLGPVIVSITLLSAGFTLAEAGLSFIGLGVESSIPTWGNIINASKSLLIMQNYPILWIAPGIAISLFVLAVNFIGDGLRDVFQPGN